MQVTRVSRSVVGDDTNFGIEEVPSLSFRSSSQLRWLPALPSRIRTIRWQTSEPYLHGPDSALSHQGRRYSQLKTSSNIGSCWPTRVQPVESCSDRRGARSSGPLPVKSLDPFYGTCHRVASICSACRLRSCSPWHHISRWSSSHNSTFDGPVRCAAARRSAPHWCCIPWPPIPPHRCSFLA